MEGRDSRATNYNAAKQASKCAVHQTRSEAEKFSLLGLHIVRLMTSIFKGKNTPIVLKDEISLISKRINYAIFFRLSSLPKSVAS